LKAVRKVVIIGHDNYGVREIFTRIVEENSAFEYILVITTGLFHRKSFFQSIIKLLKEASILFSLNRFIEMVIFYLKGDTLFKRATDYKVKIVYSKDVNDEKTYGILKKFNPDVILSTFTMHLLKRKLIELSKSVTVGCHPSILPSYRGLETFFWALANGEKESGVSVFYLTEKVDVGKIIMQEKFAISHDETVKSIYEKLTKISAKLMSQTLYKISKGETFNEYPQVVGDSYYPMPTREVYKRFKQSGKKWK